MRALLLAACLAVFPVGSPHAQDELTPDTPKHCPYCDEWNAPQEPFRIHGNTYYVGTHGLSAILIDSGQGLVLLDGGLSQSAPLIAGNLKKLGFRVQDVKLLANSHAHYDHAGGLAALQRASGAPVLASDAGTQALQAGQPVPSDPQAGFGPDENGFPPVANVRKVANGETVKLGNLELTAHWTPGHTPGSTSWTWRSCAGQRCVDVVYADSLTPVSANDFRFADEKAHPGLLQAFRRSIDTVAQLPCDVLLAPHPDFLDISGKLARRAQHLAIDPFLDPQGCRAYAQNAARKLEQRVAKESASSPADPDPAQRPAEDAQN